MSEYGLIILDGGELVGGWGLVPARGKSRDILESLL